MAVKAFIKTANAARVKASLGGSVKLTKRGKVNFTPGPSATFTVTNSILGTVTFTCKANTKKLPVLGTITVGKAGKAPVRSARLG